ncbi:MAG: response regulator transcription factor [Chloroflexi bacterium]|nr:MAG: response regulator transcription factor [Chloroflexota bacterium]
MGESGPRAGVLLVVEDHVGVRSLVSLVLTAAGYVVREAASGEEAIEFARKEQPLLVLLDVRLPGISGYEVCGWLRDRFHDSVPVIFLSGERTEAFDRAAGLMLGADDYLVKPFSNEELVARVRGLLRRTLPAPRARGVGLTARELEVLRLLAGGLIQNDIAGHLLISTKTVGTHIEHILMKLGVQSRAQAVALAYRDNLIEPNAPLPIAPSASGPATLSNGAHGDASVSFRTTTAPKPAR